MKRHTAVSDIAERLQLADDEAFGRAQKHATEGVRVERKERDYRAEAEEMFDAMLNRLVRAKAIEHIDSLRNGVPMAAMPVSPIPPPPPSPFNPTNQR